MSLGDPDVRIAWMKQVAAALPGEHSFDVQATWKNEHGHAGVALEGSELYVFLNNATRIVHSREEAIEALHAIFADELVAVAALVDGTLGGLQLCPANNPSAGFHELGRRPSVDEMIITTWSRGVLKDDE